MARHPRSEQVIAINGARLWVESAGTGPPVVFVHAGVCDARMWDPQWEPVGAVARAVRYDLRGFGLSSLPPEPFAHHEDLLALLDTLGIDQPVTLVAASMGGGVALAFTLDHPERVSKLVLLNTLAGIDEPSAALRAGWRAVGEALDQGDLDAALEIELRMWVDGPHREPDAVDPAVRALVGEMNRIILERAAEQELATEIDPEPPVLTRLAEVACPTLLITGSLDVEDARRSADRLLAGIPDVREHTIASAAHLPSLEAPVEVTDLILAFLAGR